MRRLIIVFITLLVAINIPSCAALKVKTRPEYKDVDPRAQSYVDEYKDLSKQNHLEFKRNVTIGFKHIKQGDIIGLCTWGGYFREIDLDIDYWNNASKISRLALVFHELTHCYCGREHDYGKNKKYPEKAVERLQTAINWSINGGPRPGYWDDGCPVSIMHPVIVDDDCMKSHYNEYITEMFDRCKPY